MCVVPPYGTLGAACVTEVERVMTGDAALSWMKQWRLRCLADDSWAMSVVCSDAFYVTEPMGIQGIRNGRNVMTVYAFLEFCLLPSTSPFHRAESMAQPQ